MDPVARDAVVEAMASALEASDPLCKRPWCDAVAARLLDAALGVTYTSECPDCSGTGLVADYYSQRGAENGFESDCPSCNGSGRSAPRLALIDLVPRDG